MKKIATIILILSLFLMVGCGKEASSSGGDFIGKYSGEAGSLEFLPENKLKVEFNKDNVWMVSSSSNNNKILKYVFVTKKNKVVSYDKAEYINISNEDKMIISNPCKIEKDKVILYPSSINERVFTRVDQ